MAEPLIDRPDLRVTEGEPVAQLVLHCDPADAAAIAARAGVALSATMLRVATVGDWRALHLAPDEWLLIGPADAQDGMIARIDAAKEPHSLVDIGERGLNVRIEGAAAMTLVNSQSPLDLAAESFSPGMCTRTLFGKAPILLERDVDCFRMHYARSFRNYVIGLAQAAAQDLPETRPS